MKRQVIFLFILYILSFVIIILVTSGGDSTRIEKLIIRCLVIWWWCHLLTVLLTNCIEYLPGPVEKFLVVQTVHSNQNNFFYKVNGVLIRNATNCLNHTHIFIDFTYHLLGQNLFIYHHIFISLSGLIRSEVKQYHQQETNRKMSCTNTPYT